MGVTFQNVDKFACTANIYLTITWKTAFAFDLNISDLKMNFDIASTQSPELPVRAQWDRFMAMLRPNWDTWDGVPGQNYKILFSDILMHLGRHGRNLGANERQVRGFHFQHSLLIECYTTHSGNIVKK